MGMAAVSHDGVYPLAGRAGGGELALAACLGLVHLGIQLILYLLGPVGDPLDEAPAFSIPAAAHSRKVFLTDDDETIGAFDVRAQDHVKTRHVFEPPGDLCHDLRPVGKVDVTALQDVCRSL